MTVDQFVFYIRRIQLFVFLCGRGGIIRIWRNFTDRKWSRSFASGLKHISLIFSNVLKGKLHKTKARHCFQNCYYRGSFCVRFYQQKHLTHFYRMNTVTTKFLYSFHKRRKTQNTNYEQFQFSFLMFFKERTLLIYDLTVVKTISHIEKNQVEKKTSFI